MVADVVASRQEREEREKASVLSLIKAVLDIKGVSTLNLNLQAFVHLLKTVLKPETWQNLLQVIVSPAWRGDGRRVPWPHDSKDHCSEPPIFRWFITRPKLTASVHVMYVLTTSRHFV